MVTYNCDGCGREIPEKTLRYTVSIDVRAAYEELEVGLLDLVRDHRQEMEELIRSLEARDPKEVEETIYKRMKLDLCPACQRAFIRDPLRFHPEQATDKPPVDIEAFLRSIGYGKGDAD